MLVRLGGWWLLIPCRATKREREGKGAMGEEGKDKERNHKKKQEAIALLPQKNRKRVKGMEGKRGDRETVQRQGSKITPIRATTLVAKARPSLWRSGYIKPTHRRLQGNGTSPRLQQVSYT